MSPVFEPFGILSITPPVVVGVRTSPPSAASFTVIGSSTWMSSPSRVKKRCGSTTICTSASPAGPSPGARRALAAQAQDLAVLDARRDGHIERSALGQA